MRKAKLGMGGRDCDATARKMIGGEFGKAPDRILR